MKPDIDLRTPEGRQAAARLYREGVSLAAVACRCGAPYGRVRKTLLAAGVRFRPSGHRGRLQAEAIRRKVVNHD